MKNIIGQTKNGRVFICSDCDKIHIEFYHFLFSFDEEAYIFFQEKISEIDGCYFEYVNANVSYRRKIIVPLGHRNVSMLLNQKELEELQLLLSNNKANNNINFFLSVQEIGIPIASN